MGKSARARFSKQNKNKNNNRILKNKTENSFNH
jgi:hypothetical protein